MSFLAGMLVWFVLTGWFIVGPREARMVQRFGGEVIDECQDAGFYFKMPFPISTVTRTYSLSQETVTEKVRIKTKDGVFLDLKVSAFYVINGDKIQKAAFNLSDPESQMKQIMAESVKIHAPKKDVQELYNDKDEISKEVKKSMHEFFDKHGFRIAKVVIEDPIQDKAIEEASNRVYAAKQDNAAALIEKQAIYNRKVGAAEADAKSLILRTEAAGGARVEYAKRLSEAYNAFKAGSPDVSVELLQQSIEGIDLRDAIVTASGKEGNVILVAMGARDNSDSNQLAALQALHKTGKKPLDEQ